MSPWSSTFGAVGLASFATSVDYTVEYEYGLDDDEEQTFSGPAILARLR